MPEAGALFANPFTLLTKIKAGTKLAQSGLYTNREALRDAVMLSYHL